MGDTDDIRDYFVEEADRPGVTIDVVCGRKMEDYSLEQIYYLNIDNN